MSIVFCESFNSYATSSDFVNGKWTSNAVQFPTLGAGTGKFGANKVTPSSSSNSYLWKDLGSGRTDTNIGFWLDFNSANSSSQVAAFIANSASATAGSLFGFNTQSGSVVFYNGAASPAVVGTLPVGTLAVGKTYWVEMRITTGGMTCYIDGLQVFSYTGSMTIGTGISFVGGPGNSPYLSISHLCVWDSSGSTMKDFPLGPQRIQLLRPTAAGDSAQWTPASGTNWAAIDATNWAGGVGVKTQVNARDDLVNVTDMAWNPWRIGAVSAAIRALDSNSGGSAVRLLTKDNGTISVGASNALPMNNPITVVQNFPQSSLSAAWTKADIDALQIGYRSVI